MKILLVYYFRTGFTEKVMSKVKDSLVERGHIVEIEKLQVIKKTSCIGEILKDLHHYPLIFFTLFSVSFRKWYIANDIQIEEDIAPLQYPDVSGFDRICIGGSKWVQVSYPVARYLRTVWGLEGKNIASVATFGGPPLPVFDLEMIEKAMS